MVFALLTILPVMCVSSEPQPGHELDFWCGSWSVYAEGMLAGHDKIETGAKGFVVYEHWKDASGPTGESFFYYIPAKRRWKQVWVTDGGPYKEKLSEPFDNGIRFVGKVFLPDGREILDRTTLTREAGGSVRQVIEWSKNGRTWTRSFDAMYKRS